MSITYPKSKVLGAPDVKAFPKTQYDKIVEIIDVVNDLSDGSVTTSAITPSTGTLAVTGSETVSGNLAVTGSTSLTGLFYLTGTPQTLTGAGAVNLTTKTTLLVTNAANALTLAAGADGQVKIITMKTDGGDGTLTVTGARGFSTITFTAVGQTATLLYKDGAWLILAVFGATVA